MADLNDLKEFAEGLVPLVKDLFELAADDEDRPNRRAERALVRRLKRFVSASGSPTRASLAQRAESIGTSHTALTEILLQASTRHVALSPRTVRTINTRLNALQNAFGLLLIRFAFEDIAKLLTEGEMVRISNLLDRADEEIAQRRKAKQTLDTIVKVAITASKIATKLG